jgi:hypothetical protein
MTSIKIKAGVDLAAKYGLIKDDSFGNAGFRLGENGAIGKMGYVLWRDPKNRERIVLVTKLDGTVVSFDDYDVFYDVVKDGNVEKAV